MSSGGHTAATPRFIRAHHSRASRSATLSALSTGPLDSVTAAAAGGSSVALALLAKASLNMAPI
jgi:hypothetical protein